jgi:hypothetical protein
VLKNLHLTDILQHALGRDAPQRFMRLKALYFVLDDLRVNRRGRCDTLCRIAAALAYQFGQISIPLV